MFLRHNFLLSFNDIQNETNKRASKKDKIDRKDNLLKGRKWEYSEKKKSSLETPLDVGDKNP